MKTLTAEEKAEVHGLSTIIRSVLNRHPMMVDGKCTGPECGFVSSAAEKRSMGRCLRNHQTFELVQAIQEWYFEEEES